MQAMQQEIDSLQGNSYIAAARIEMEELRGQELESEITRVKSVESRMRERLSTPSPRHWSSRQSSYSKVLLSFRSTRYC